MKPTKTQLRYLLAANDYVIDSGCITLLRLRVDVLLRLERDGYLKFQPYAKPPQWKLTTKGIQAITV